MPGLPALGGYGLGLGLLPLIPWNCPTHLTACEALSLASACPCQLSWAWKVEGLGSVGSPQLCLHKSECRARPVGCQLLLSPPSPTLSLVLSYLVDSTGVALSPGSCLPLSAEQDSGRVQEGAESLPCGPSPLIQVSTAGGSLCFPTFSSALPSWTHMVKQEQD